MIYELLPILQTFVVETLVGSHCVLKPFPCVLVFPKANESSFTKPIILRIINPSIAKAISCPLDPGNVAGHHILGAERAWGLGAAVAHEAALDIEAAHHFCLLPGDHMLGRAWHLS